MPSKTEFSLEKIAEAYEILAAEYEHLCGACKRYRSQHVKGRCLFMPTKFTPMPNECAEIAKELRKRCQN